jgi:ferrochelatase
MIGVLLMAYGGPSSLDQVEAYYTDIRGGRRPSPEALQGLVERYRAIGGLSPLPEISRRQQEALGALLEAKEPGRFRTYIGMKHWHPYIAEAVKAAAADRVEALIGLVLAPHYSGMSIGGYEERLRRAREEAGAGFEVRMVRSWHDDPAFVEFVAANLRGTLEGWEPADGTTRVFFTAHSLPERILAAGDPYRDELLESSRLVAASAGVEDWEFAFQSASETGEPWLGPDILDRLEAFASQGGRRAVVAPIGFVADHLEVLYDVDIECASRARDIGLELRRIPSPNHDSWFIEALAGIVVSVARDLDPSYAGTDRRTDHP